MKYGKPPPRRQKRTEAYVQDDAGKPIFNPRVCVRIYSSVRAQRNRKPGGSLQTKAASLNVRLPSTHPGCTKSNCPARPCVSPFTAGQRWP